MHRRCRLQQDFEILLRYRLTRQSHLLTRTGHLLPERALTCSPSYHPGGVAERMGNLRQFAHDAGGIDAEQQIELAANLSRGLSLRPLTAKIILKVLSSRTSPLLHRCRPNNNVAVRLFSNEAW